MSAQEAALPYQQRLRDFERLLETAQQIIVAQLETFAREGKMHLADARAAQLASLQQTITQLGAKIVPLAAELVHESYEQGAARAAHQIAGLQIDAPEIPGAFNGISLPAVEALQRSLTMRLDDALQTLGRRIEDVFAREQRRVALQAVLGAQPSPGAASKELQSRLAQEGSTGFVDSAGRQWSLDTYAKMATRTVTREAVVHGAMARMVSHGISIGRISTHANSCDICAPYQGTLVSLAGEASEWKGQAVSDGSELPPFHPNCEHSIEPVATGVEDLAAELAAA